MRPSLLLSVAFSCGLLLSSCGGSGKSTQDADSPSPKAKQGQSSPTPLQGSAPELVPFAGDGFSVSLPTRPRRITQEVELPGGTVELVAFVSEPTGKSAFVVSYVELGGQGVDLQGAINGAAQNIGGTVRDEKTVTYQGFPGREARIANGRGGTVTGFLRAIIANDRLYSIQYTAEGGDITMPPAIYRQVLDSLKID